MMRYYLNVHFQGQRINFLDLALDLLDVYIISLSHTHAHTHTHTPCQQVILWRI